MRLILAFLGSHLISGEAFFDKVDLDIGYAELRLQE